MDRAKLFDSLDGLFAYDTGSIDSGIYDSQLRAKVKLELQRQADFEENSDRIVPKIIDEFCYEHYLAPEQRKAGYGVEEIIEFIKWLEELMGWDIL